jgi:hypothetical protein
LEKIDLTNANEKLQRARDTKVPEVTVLPFDLLSRRTNKTTKLVANSGDDNPMHGANRWFEYEFSEPVFLCEIAILMENYGSYDTFDFQWEMASGGKASHEISRESDTLVRTSINQLVKSVAFKPPKKWFRDPTISSVALKGFQLEELEGFVQTVSRLDRLKNDVVAAGDEALQNADKANVRVEELRQENDAIQDEIKTANSTVTDLNNQIGRLTEERNGIMADIAKRENTISKLSEQETQVGELIAERNSERTTLAAQVTVQKQELRSLQNDINMFPTEISGFVSQAAQNTSSYWRFASVPILIMVVLTGLLIFNAANLTTVIDENENARIFSILATRLPYVIIATAIIGAAYKLAALLVSEIMRINQQRLNLSKVSIIATDISDASAEGLTELSEEDLWQLKTRLKMDMLRDHLKDYLSKNFQSAEKKRLPQPAKTEDHSQIDGENASDDDK